MHFHLHNKLPFTRVTYCGMESRNYSISFLVRQIDSSKKGFSVKDYKTLNTFKTLKLTLFLLELSNFGSKLCAEMNFYCLTYIFLVFFVGL